MVVQATRRGLVQVVLVLGMVVVHPPQGVTGRQTWVVAVAAVRMAAAMPNTLAGTVALV